MAYQTLYRAWRPDRFSKIVGQTAVVETLRNQVRTGHINHAYLFCGTRGTGKTTAAKLFSRAINCLSPADGEPCGTCAACTGLAAETNTDILEIDAASNTGVDNIRELIDRVKYPPQIGRYKVYIIDEVHMLSVSAFNALLKTLEEPPAHAVFILATTEPQKLPVTILSRCQRYDFRRISSGDITQRLRLIADSIPVTYEEEALTQLARASDGAMRDAISLLELCISLGQGNVTQEIVRGALGASGSGAKFAFVDALAAADPAAALLQIENVLSGGVESAVFCGEITRHLRCVLVAAALEDCAALLDVSKEDAAQYVKQAKAMGPERALRAMELFLRAQSDMSYAAQPRMALELAAFRACRPEVDKSLDGLLERVEKLEKAVENGITAAPAPAKAASGKAPQRPAAPARPRVDPQNEGALWQAVLKSVKQERISLYSPLRFAQFLGIKNGQALLSFTPENAMYNTLIDREENRAFIEKIVSEISGAPVTLHMTVEAPPPPPAPSDESEIGRMSALFGRENIEVVDS